ncbi:aldose epimerase family protein [Thioclava sp. FR2]|uniref:aldose epimerase family protein n=1 Tax=Thioclava sp. FR2 TaxID=3445780 RepID=UPI003EBCFB3D
MDVSQNNRKPWGEINGKSVGLLTISDGGSCRALLSDFGARLVQLWAPDRDGKLADIVLGHDKAEEYLAPESRYIGATCGRYANRIANAHFHLDGEDYQLQANEGEKQLHGGKDGFDSQVWKVTSASTTGVSFGLTSADGDMGYPGTLAAEASYTFTAPNTLEISFRAVVSDKPTVVNLVNHAYFNLAGQGSGSIDHHLLTIAADHYLAVDKDLIPVGNPTAVAGTPFDFRQQRPLDADVPPGGFDHNFCLTAQNQPQITAVDPVSRRGFKLWTDQPGVQLYTAGHFPSGYPGKNGARIGPRGGFAVETQRWPDSPNRPDFPSATLRPNEVYNHHMRFQFFAD